MTSFPFLRVLFTSLWLPKRKDYRYFLNEGRFELAVRVLCGTDIIELSRMGAVLERRPRLLERLFDPTETRYARAHADPTPYLAARFCAKEAVMKLLGRGIGSINFRDIVVVRESMQRPKIELTGSAARLAVELGLKDLDVSLSHSETMAMAMVVGIIED